RLGQGDLHARAGRLDVTDVHQTGEGRRPQARDGPAAGVEREVLAAPAVVPPRRHDPGVLAVEVALLRLGDGGLVPGVTLVHRVPQRVRLDEGLGLLPVLV